MRKQLEKQIVTDDLGSSLTRDSNRPPRPPRSGALFTLGRCVADDLPVILEALTSKSPQQELVVGIFDLCQEDPDRTTDMPSLEEHLGISRPAILKRAGHLTQAGLLTVDKRQVYAHARSVNVYELHRPDPKALIAQEGAAAGPPEVPSPALEEQPRFDFGGGQLASSRQLHFHPEISRRLAWKGERFIVFSLLAGLRVGRTGRETNRKETRIYIGERWFTLQVRAPVDVQIPSVVDLRVLIIVCTLIKDHLEHRTTGSAESSDKGYLITMAEICEAMGVEPLPGNKRYLFQQLQRWRFSEFVVREDHGALQWAKGTFEVDRSFAVIDELTILKHVTEQGTTPELVHLVLNDRIEAALQDVGRSLSVHREILRERKPKPLKHLLYYWCRRVVQHSAELRVFRLAHLHRELRPHISLKRFRSEFTELLAELRAASSANVPRIPGYFVRYDRTREEVSIVADPADPIVGERSPKRLK